MEHIITSINLLQLFFFLKSIATRNQRVMWAELSYSVTELIIWKALHSNYCVQTSDKHLRKYTDETADGQMV